jgi:hypothetical protein
MMEEVVWQDNTRGEHPIFYSAAVVGTRMNLFSRDDVG